MKNILIIFICILLFQGLSYGEPETEVPAETKPNIEEPKFILEEQVSDIEVFGENKFFGLRNKTSQEIIVKPEYSKLVRVGKTGWIIQKNGKFGLINSNGDYLLRPKYRHVERILGRYVKIGNDSDFGIYDEFGKEILPPVYNSIDLLYGKMFLTYKNFRYGVSDFKGNTLIANICDDIYMPDRNTMKIKYLGSWYEIEDVSAEKLAMPDVVSDMKKNSEFKVTDIVSDTGAISGYSLLTFSDYFIKIFSSISPAHEETIDDLILSHGVDTMDIIKNFSWIPKYPVTFGKKYYVHVRNPFNGPLSDLRNSLKSKI